MTTNKKNEQFEIIIVGGGLAGLSLAALLGRHGIKIACIDEADPSIKPKDLRTTVISYGSRQILERADIWKHIKEAAPIHDIQILDGSSPILLEFLNSEVDGKVFGWNIDNHDLKLALMNRIDSFETVQHIFKEKVIGFNIDSDIASVQLRGGRTLSASLIVGADGRASGAREFMARHYGLSTKNWSYNQRAVICSVSHERPHDNVAIEHFWPEGPFAALPLVDDEKGRHRSSVVFTEHGPKQNSLMNLTDEEFELALASRFPKSYGEIKLNTARKAYPLSLIHADRYIAPRMALAADAAHGIHPIAGQGLNLGFRDIGVLDDLLSTAYKNGDDLGSDELLEKYQSARRFDNMSMAAMTDALNRLFSNNIAPVRFARKIGLKAVSKIKPAKRFFMKQAMGDQ